LFLAGASDDAESYTAAARVYSRGTEVRGTGR
jgi:hypothetical protein